MKWHDILKGEIKECITFILDDKVESSRPRSHHQILPKKSLLLLVFLTVLIKVYEKRKRKK